MDQHGRGAITGLKQHTVGGAASLQGVFQFEAVPLGAQTAQTNDPIVDRQLDVRRVVAVLVTLIFEAS